MKDKQWIWQPGQFCLSYFHVIMTTYVARLLIFLVLSSAFMTACGLGGGAADTNPFDDNPAGDETLEDESEPGQGTRTAVPASESEEAAAQVPDTTLDIDPGSVEVDAHGFEVGFTGDGHPFRGNATAPVVMEEFSDYQCPFCARFTNQTLPDLHDNQVSNGEVVLVFYDFPLTSIHPQATAAANAARCAGEQGAAAYWAMHDRLFTNPDEWSNNNANSVFSRYAEELELETDEFDSCLESDKYAQDIQADVDYGRSRGVSSTPSFFLNGQPLVGAQPISVFNASIQTVKEGGEVVSNQPPAQEEAGQPALAPTPATIPVEEVAATLGDPDAPITIVEYTDYQCPYCQRHATETMPQLMDEMVETGRAYYVLKDFPLDSIHPAARTAAVAARCAGEQNAYWEMHDLLFQTQSQWSSEGVDTEQVLISLASDLELGVDAFRECLSSGRYDAAVQANLDEGVSLGVRGTPGFFIDGYPLQGAQPFNVFDYAVGLAEEGTLADAYTQQPQQQEEARQEPPEPADIPLDDVAHSIGDPDAPVVIVEYTDFQCPYCSRHFQQTFPQIKENYVDTGQVRYVFKDFPLTSIHPQAVLAAQAARCAGDQEAYLEMHDVLFNKQQEWSSSDAAQIFVGYADELGLDSTTFEQCLDSKQHEAAVMADLEEGTRLGVTGTPAFFLNGYLLSGAQPYSVFEEAVTYLMSEQ